MSDRPLKGRISTEHTVWCGAGQASLSSVGRPAWSVWYLCVSHYQFSERPAAAWARQEGWVLTRQFGWLCPSCAKTWRNR